MILGMRYFSGKKVLLHWHGPWQITPRLLPAMAVWYHYNNYGNGKFPNTSIVFGLSGSGKSTMTHEKQWSLPVSLLSCMMIEVYRNVYAEI